MALLNLYIRKYLDILQYLRSMWTKNNLFDMIILILRKRETICCSLRQSVLEGLSSDLIWLSQNLTKLSSDWIIPEDIRKADCNETGG